MKSNTKGHRKLALGFVIILILILVVTGFVYETDEFPNWVWWLAAGLLGVIILTMWYFSRNSSKMENSEGGVFSSIMDILFFSADALGWILFLIFEFVKS